jgi:MoxR-like ATPase
MRLKEQLIMEAADITDTTVPKTELTYSDVLTAIINHSEGKINTGNMKEIADDLNIKPNLLSRIVDRAKKEKFLISNGRPAAKYIKQIKSAKPTKPSKDIEPAPKSGSAKVATSGKVSDSLNAKKKRFRAPKVTNNNLFSQQVFDILSLMDGQAAKSGIKNSLMLTGDPGVGKTSFIRNYAKLLGIPLVTIEAPHITEEHIINIPFMILKGDKIKKDSATIEIEGNHTLEDSATSFDIVQSESNLVTTLKSMKAKKLKTEQHITGIAKDKNLRGVYLKYRTLIDIVREQYHCILFLDEYYRNDNMKIRNILRNILNGRIGNDKIPKGTFIVYASNLDDDGLSEIPMNNDFADMEFAAPDKEQWFDYILKKYETNETKDHPSVTLDPKVYNKFYDTLKQAELSFEDEDSEVRSSPRRWEQFLIYVNANLPVSNVKEAKILMSNAEVNFRNYIEGDVSSIYPKIQKMLVELVKETSDIDFDGSTHPQTEWKDVLEQQLSTKIALDAETENVDKEARTYVPIVSGEPGIGKTAHMSTVADNLDLHFIHIDVSTLQRESTTGIPTASEVVENGKPVLDHNGNTVMITKFSKPELLNMIEEKMAEAIKEDSIFPESERKKGKGKYKFLLLFDELTRADAQVFNSIRKLLLEKSFNEKYDLPIEVMVVGALNPEDDGVGELTKHTRDVVDVIPARASWAKTETYLLGSERPEGLEEALSFDCNAATVGAVKSLLSHFKTRDYDWRGNPVNREEKMFNIVDEGNVIYISPREITDLVSMINSKILNTLTRVGIESSLDGAVDNAIDDQSDDAFLAALKSGNAGVTKQTLELEKGIFNPSTNYSEEDFKAFLDAIIVVFRQQWVLKLKFVLKKQELKASLPNFLSVTTGYITKNNSIRDQYDGLKTQQITDTKTMGELMDSFYENPQELYDSPYFDNYLEANLTNPHKFVQEITEFMADKVGDIQKSDNSGTTTVTNRTGGTYDMPIMDKKNFKLFYTYLQYVKVLLKVLTEKAEYADHIREAERTGQYLSNLHASLNSIGDSFLNDHELYVYYSFPDRLDGALADKIVATSSSIREVLEKFGFKRKDT